MDEARAVLERLERIEALDRAGAAPPALLSELRALVREAEQWAWRDGGGRALDAVSRCRVALAGEGGAAERR